MKIIKHTKQSFLFHKDTPWVKKGTNFDVSMGSFDGAETCELVGLYMLSKLKETDLNIGLYRDDGLAASHLTPRQTEVMKKKICQIFKKEGLNVTIEANTKITDFLDITLDLQNNNYRPFTKKENTTIYINRSSNHPRSVLKNIPASVNKRISTNSSSEVIFNEAKNTFSEALTKSGYKYRMKYDRTTSEVEDPEAATRLPNRSIQNKPNRNRKRNVLYFNPPFCSSVKTNIGRTFLN